MQVGVIGGAKLCRMCRQAFSQTGSESLTVYSASQAYSGTLGATERASCLGGWTLLGLGLHVGGEIERHEPAAFRVIDYGGKYYFAPCLSN